MCCTNQQIYAFENVGGLKKLVEHIRYNKSNGEEALMRFVFNYGEHPKLINNQSTDMSHVALVEGLLD